MFNGSIIVKKDEFDKIMEFFQNLYDKSDVPGKNNITNPVIQIEFAGSGDSGDFTDVQVLDNNGHPYDVAGFSEITTMDVEVRDALYSMLPPGWEIDEGSCGKIVVNLKDRKITIYYEEFFTHPRSHVIDVVEK